MGNGNPYFPKFHELYFSFEFKTHFVVNQMPNNLLSLLLTILEIYYTFQWIAHGILVAILTE